MTAPVKPLETLSSPEAIGAAALMMLFGFGPLLSGLPILGLLITCGIGLALLAGAVIGGNHILAVLTLAYGGVLVAITYTGAEVSWLFLPPVVVLLLVLSDLMRVAFVRRRGAVVSDQLLVAPLLGSLAAGGAAIFSSGLVAVITDAGDGGSWLWTPVAIGLLMIFGFIVLMVPRRGATEADRRRWTPGEPLPPGPRGH